MKLPEASPGSNRAGAAHGEADCPPQPMKVHGGAKIHLQSVKDLAVEQVDA